MDRREFIKKSVAGSLAGAGIFTNVNDAFAVSVPEIEKNVAVKRSLIMYASRTNNTSKVAERFKSTFERNGWQCDIFRIEKDSDPAAIPYAIKDYDFVCAGSGINLHAPYPELLAAIRFPRYGFDPANVTVAPGDSPPDGEKAPTHSKIVFGPHSKKAVSFVTYGGLEFGPWEVQPALDWINVEMAHLDIEPVGTFCCPGKFLPYDIPAGYFNDLTTRPNEKDLMRAELFIEQILETIATRPAPTAGKERDD